VKAVTPVIIEAFLDVFGGCRKLCGEDGNLLVRLKQQQ